MKRVLLIAACVSLPLALTGCDVLNYIWQHIVGHSYSQVDLASLENNAGNMSVTTIGQSSMPANSVVGYKSRHGDYGKLGVISISSSTLTFQFTTYNSQDGSVMISSASVTVHSPDCFDLESGTEGPAEGATGDFQWFRGTLQPVNGALLSVFP
jgi:hypothetical protein